MSTLIVTYTGVTAIADKSPASTVKLSLGFVRFLARLAKWCAWREQQKSGGGVVVAKKKGNNDGNEKSSPGSRLIFRVNVSYLPGYNEFLALSPCAGANLKREKNRGAGADTVVGTRWIMNRRWLTEVLLDPPFSISGGLSGALIM